MDARFFRQLIQRVRAGDEQAVAEMVRQYEPDIRAYIRKRLDGQPQLAGLFDSEDIWQSVVRQFLTRLANGGFTLEAPEDLAKLLTRMARNNLANKAKAEGAGKRDRRRTLSPEVEQLEAIAGADPTPSTLASLKELVAKVADQLSPFERFLVEQRSEGRSWEAIARDIGDNIGAKALSRRFERAVKKASKVLRPDERTP